MDTAQGTNQHREEVIRLLTQLNERQKTIFNHLSRIDNHLDKLNGSVGEHEKQLTVFKTWGAVILITVPIIVNIMMEMMK